MLDTTQIDTCRLSARQSKLALALDQLYAALNQRQYVNPDPLQFLYRYQDPKDREVVAMIASALAYGRVAQILKGVSLVLDRITPGPADFLKKASRDSLLQKFADFKYRFTTGQELAAMLFAIGRTAGQYGSLQKCFAACMDNGDQTVAAATGRFISRLMTNTDNPCKSLLPRPAGTSACKRINLFLRWMVRSDQVDPGGWECIGPDKLIVPLDTHMHKIGLALGLTRRSAANMSTALEITSAFREIEPTDPVKFDFALTRLGIREDTDLNLFLKMAGPNVTGKL